MVHFKLITIERVLVDQPVDELIVQTPEGATGILSGHIPLLSVVIAGTLRYKAGAREFRLVASGGSLEVRNNRATMLVTEVTAVENIDLRQAEAERERLLNVLNRGTLTVMQLRDARKELATVRAKIAAAARH